MPIDQTEVNTIVKGLFLPLLKYFVEGRAVAEELLWAAVRIVSPHWELIHRIPVSSSPTTTETDPLKGSGFSMILNRDIPPHRSSSGGVVSLSEGLVPTEGPMGDADATWIWDPKDPFNGATQSLPAEIQRGMALGWDNEASITWEIIAVVGFS